MLRELNVVEQRYQAVLEVLDDIPVTEVAERFGVTRQTVHRWVARYRESGLAGLAGRSHVPKAHPWQLSAEVEAVICDLRTAHRSWGPRRLVFELERRGHPGVSRSTVYRVLVRRHLIEPVSRRRRRDSCRRWERSAAMELWQMDVTASLFLAGGRECKVITGIDDHSRFCVIAAVVMRATARAVCLAFTAAMTEYGISFEVLTGNGKQFTGRFGKPRPAEVLSGRICRESGITQRLTKPRSPRPPGRSSGCTGPCSWNCSTSACRSPASRTPRPRWTPGARTATPCDRTSPWTWPSPPPGSPPQLAAVSACGYPPG
jgi:transposase